MKVYRPANALEKYGMFPCKVFLHKENAAATFPNDEIVELDLETVNGPEFLDTRRILATYYFEPPLFQPVGEENYFIDEINVEEIFCFNQNKVLFRLSDQVDKHLGLMDYFPTRNEVNEFICK